MKKLTYLFVPVMPGMSAWAVQGFIESAEKIDDATNNPEVISSDVLLKLTDGFVTPAGETVFVPYRNVVSVISYLKLASHDTFSQPLDRGGFLVSGVFSDDNWNLLFSDPDSVVPLAFAKVVSK